jgi:hypothetical protein
MTLSSLSAEIDSATREFRRLQGFRIVNGQYRQRNADVERLIVLTAERIARLWKFHGLIGAKETLDSFQRARDGSPVKQSSR